MNSINDIEMNVEIEKGDLVIVEDFRNKEYIGIVTDINMGNNGSSFKLGATFDIDYGESHDIRISSTDCKIKEVHKNSMMSIDSILKIKSLSRALGIKEVHLLDMIIEVGLGKIRCELQSSMGLSYKDLIVEK